MNNAIYKSFLVGIEFMLDVYFKQLRFTYSACGVFTKNKERIQNLKKQKI